HGAETRAVARSGAFGLFGAGVAALGGFALTGVVTHGLGPAGAGVFFEAFALFTILAAVGTAGADTALLYTATRARALGRVAELRRVMAIAFGPSVLAATALAVVLWAAAPGLARLLTDEAHQEQGADFLAVLAPFLVCAITGLIAVQATRGFGGLRIYVGLQQLALPLGRVLLVAAVLAFGARGLAVPLAWAVPLLLTCPLALWALAGQLRRTERALLPASAPPRPVREVAREFWAYAAGRGFAQAFTQSIVWFDVIIVGALRSAHEAGIYAAASRFVTTGTLVMQAMRLAIQPQVGAALAVGDTRRAEDLYRISTQWITASSWPLYLVLATFGPQVLRVFGEEFADGADALSILAVAMLLNLATGNVNTVLLMAGKSRWTALNTVVALAVNVGLNLLLVPDHGIVGAAIAWSASIVCEQALGMYQVRFLLGLRGHGRGFVLSAALAAVVFGGGGLALRLAAGTDLWVFATYVTAATALYAAVLWRFRATLELPALLTTIRARRPRTPAPAVQARVWRAREATGTTRAQPAMGVSSRSRAVARDFTSPVLVSRDWATRTAAPAALARVTVSEWLSSPDVSSTTQVPPPVSSAISARNSSLAITSRAPPPMSSPRATRRPGMLVVCRVTLPVPPAAASGARPGAAGPRQPGATRTTSPSASARAVARLAPGSARWAGPVRSATSSTRVPRRRRAGTSSARSRRYDSAAGPAGSSTSASVAAPDGISASSGAPAASPASRPPPIRPSNPSRANAAATASTSAASTPPASISGSSAGELATAVSALSSTDPGWKETAWRSFRRSVSPCTSRSANCRSASASWASAEPATAAASASSAAISAARASPIDTSMLSSISSWRDRAWVSRLPR
ncbi:MATE family efflux transporter, partial [Streptomyces sp. URMC 129]|uniref:MATE family efflux transporter n=1 Tax=Streptomyces sp. URMC 129 TaxID=3423407 RepID=UPI003F1A480B